MEIKKMRITPEIAKIFLGNNTRNRALSEKTVTLYAKEMREGRWEKDNPTPIVFGESGVLKDGQHRLAAIVRSGVPLEAIVATVDDGVNVFDAGKVRSCGDYIRMFSDVDSSLSHASLVSAVNVHLSNGSKNKVSRTRIQEYIEKHQMPLKMAREMCMSKEVQKSAFVHAIYCALIYGVDSNKLKRFTEIVKTGLATSEGDSAAVFCRNYLQKMAKAHRMYPIEESKRYQTYIKKFIDEEHMKQDLRATSGVYSDFVYRVEGKNNETDRR